MSDLHRADAEAAIREATLGIRALTHLAIAATLHASADDDEQRLRTALTAVFGHEAAALRIVDCLGETALGLPPEEVDEA
jgi:hypothetical protein